MRFAVARKPFPAHAAQAEPVADRAAPTATDSRARTLRRKYRAPLIIFAAYAVVIGVNEWRLRSHVAAAEQVEQPPPLEELTVIEP